MYSGWRSPDHDLRQIAGNLLPESRFGYYFLRLTSERLLQNIARLEKIIEQSRTDLKDSAKDTN